jgi:hypothetical protein
MLQMAWDNGYRKDNPVRGIKLKDVPAKPIIVATKDQFLRVYNALPHQPAKVLAPPRGFFGRPAVRADLIHPGGLRLRRGHARRAQIHRESDREVPPPGTGFSRASTPRTATIAGSKSITRSRKWCGTTSPFTKSGPAR